jgi:uncharacterized membrane protein YeaQ/YmgE (transglycosylase-associated protein family)
MSIIAWLVFGGIIGWIASMIAGTDRQQGIVMNIIVGIVGAIIGGFVMSIFGKSGVTGFNLYSALVAIVGAVILLFVYRSLSHA